MKKRLVTIAFGALLAALSLNVGCTSDSLEELTLVNQGGKGCNTPAVVSYQNDLVPILTTTCGTTNSCHDNTAGIPLYNHTFIQVAALSGKLESSLIWDGNASAMPKGSPTKLDSCTIEKFKAWIKAGAPNN